MISMMLVDMAFPASYSETHKVSYLATSLLVGGITYTIAFLLIPLAAIKSEKERFIKILRISKEQSK